MPLKFYFFIFLLSLIFLSKLCNNTAGVILSIKVVGLDPIFFSKKKSTGGEKQLSAGINHRSKWHFIGYG
jgi:hypothetical protein